MLFYHWALWFYNMFRKSVNSGFLLQSGAAQLEKIGIGELWDRWRTSLSIFAMVFASYRADINTVKVNLYFGP